MAGSLLAGALHLRESSLTAKSHIIFSEGVKLLSTEAVHKSYVRKDGKDGTLWTSVVRHPSGQRIKDRKQYT